jgi:acylphosphatase
VYINRQIKVFGKVQGVYFRAFTEKKANQLGLCGWVKNEPDDSVLIEVEGHLMKVDEMTEWAKTGSPLSKVSHIEFKDGELKHFNSFRILKF